MENSLKLCIIITVPHASGCGEYLSNNLHPCDSAALKLADWFVEAVKNYKLIQLKGPYVSSTPRDLEGNDMNRKESRSTEYRQHLRRVTKKAIKEYEKVWVIDVHSFPPDFRYPTKNDVDFVVLDTRNHGPKTDYVNNMISTLQKKKISVEDIEGAHSTGDETNDIMDTSRSLGANSFLIEAKEGISNEEMKRTANEIISFINYQSSLS